MKVVCFWWLSAVLLFASALEMDVIDFESQHVTCSKGLSNCTLEDVTLLSQECPVGLKAEPGLRVKSVLCCVRGTKCQPCLQVHFDLQPREHQTASYVDVCHKVPQTTFPKCNKLEFTVTPAGQDGEAKPSLWLSLLLMNELKMHEVTLHIEKENDSRYPVEMCLKHGENAVCKNWREKTIPFHSVTPCMCFQVWWDRGHDTRSHRLQICPFINQTARFQKNVWDNVSVTVVQGQMNSGGAMLSWNVTAPCRLEGAAWLCQRDDGADQNSCTKLKGREQPLLNVTWKEKDGHWLFPGVFENITPGPDMCVMMKVTGRSSEFGRFCLTDSRLWHWRWSLLVLVSLMLFGLAAICLYFLHGKLKRWAWQWHQRKCYQSNRGRVVLLSPPDADASVSELLCKLGSTVSARGLTVSVDLWSQKDLCSLGPLPWLHSQLEPLDSQRSRAILVLTQSACQKAEAWGQQLGRQDRGPEEQGKKCVEGEAKRLLQDKSPYADVFSAALSCVKADQQQGCAGKRFLLVQFEARPAVPRGVKWAPPQLFKGLPMFYLPSQDQELFSELAMWPRVIRNRLLRSRWPACRGRYPVLYCLGDWEQEAMRTFCPVLAAGLYSVLNLAVLVGGCPDACKECSGPDNHLCLECQNGWTLHDNTCVDIDECGTELGPCPPNTYCFNIEGNYECKDCDKACVGCMGNGPARCRKCATGYRLTGAKCLDVDECSEQVLACPGLDEICTNVEGSFSCDCAEGLTRKENSCVQKQLPRGGDEKGLFEDIQDDEVEVLQQMFFGVLLCALATLAAKGDMVFTSIFMGGVVAMAGYWLSDRGNRALDSFLKGG
ncbi:hypothetical protein DPEC_G00197470 [Dallia pectoralis]|uniref:Uncharacterized protein n=1 Tax=Dallia pectoralis TaxID=75939 RepID=A0ACC2G7Z7_DALPE|nr:hypothetical protein DPEC_G00197470 [Dallia pectoralis]